MDSGAGTPRRTPPPRSRDSGRGVFRKAPILRLGSPGSKRGQGRRTPIKGGSESGRARSHGRRCRRRRRRRGAPHGPTAGFRGCPSASGGEFSGPVGEHAWPEKSGFHARIADPNSPVAPLCRARPTTLSAQIIDASDQWSAPRRPDVTATFSPRTGSTPRWRRISLSRAVQPPTLAP